MTLLGELFNYFPAHLLLGLTFGSIVVLLITLTLFSAAVIWLLNLFCEVDKGQYRLAKKLIGTLSVISLSFAANNLFIYLFSSIIIATLVTEEEFIKEVAGKIIQLIEKALEEDGHPKVSR